MSQTVYEQLGGEAGIKALVREFYRVMDELPEARAVRQMHPEDLRGSEEKLYYFLSGWSGGPQLFIEKFGHPMLRRRHFPFAIGVAERDQWMLCMERAMRNVGVTEPLFTSLLQAFRQVADHMRNQNA